jgi:hypothetical protein
MDYAEETWPSKKSEPSVAAFKRAKTKLDWRGGGGPNI